MINRIEEIEIEVVGVAVPDYDSLEWFRSLQKYRAWNEQAIWAVLALMGRPRSYLDLGCGDGTMLKTIRRAGVAQVLGIEVSSWAKIAAGKRVKVPIKVFDLAREFDLGRSFDLVTCIEVAEHIQPEGTEMFLANIARHVNNWLVFTAAPPGQGGDGHINCREPVYWIEALESLGLTYDGSSTSRLAEHWRWATGPMFWLPQNCMVFRRED